MLFTTSADGILDTQVLHLDGTVKLVQLPLDDRHTPSFFITASSVYDRALATNTVRVVVPPVAHFLDVGVKADRDEYRPRDEGSLTVTTRDVDGKPVSAEVALAVSDESVAAISKDPAGDPRMFFFENRSGMALQAMASVQAQRYVTLVEKDGKLIDERDLANARRDEEAKDKVEGGVEAGVAGGVAGGTIRMNEQRAMNAPSSRMAKSASVAEAITVTAAAPALAPQAPGSIEVVVRSDFRSTAFWQPDVRTGPDGVATVNVKFPEALTTWRATARAVTAATQVGMGSTTTRTSMPMLVRLEAPRFFVAGGRATVSAVVNNNTDRPLRVHPSIDVEGLTLSPGATALSRSLDVPPHGEARADWAVTADHAGAEIRANGDEVRMQVR